MPKNLLEFCVWRVAMVLLLMLLLVAMGLELRLSSALSHEIYMHATSPDEVVFMEVARVAHIWQFSIGYGPAFWGIPISLLKVFSFDTTAFVARVLFVLMKYLAFLVPTWCLWRNGLHGRAVLFLILVLSVPGFFLFGKTISPEYELLLFTSLSVTCLFQDRGRLTGLYVAAVFFASMAVCAKVSAGMYLIAVTCCGIYCAWFGVRRSLRDGFRVLLPAVVCGLVFWVSILWLCGPEAIVAQIKDAFSIVAQPRYDMDMLKLALWRDEATWDRILIGGGMVDFLPIVLGAGYVLFRTRPCDDNFPIVVGVLGCALVLFVQFASRGSAFGWYLYQPAFLVAVCAVFCGPQHQDGGWCELVFLLLIVVAATLHGGVRIAKRMAYKSTNLTSVLVHERDMSMIRSYINQAWPCVRSVDLDIMVPSSLSVQNEVPMHLALNKLTRGVWMPSDAVVVVARPDHLEESMLINFVVRDHAEEYVERWRKGDVALLIHKRVQAGMCRKSTAR